MDDALNESRTYSSLDEVMTKLIAARGKTFRELDQTGRISTKGNKGSLGNIIEESVLGYPVNSDPEADIQIGDERYELKVTPLKHVRKGKETSAKERLVIDIIDFMELSKEQRFETSRMWQKAKNILLVYYYDDREDKKKELRIDCRVLDSLILDYQDEDLSTIKHDWQIIRDKVASGHADELSESDTNYLAACTKGQGNAALKGAVQNTAPTNAENGQKLNDLRQAPATKDSDTPTITVKQRAFSYKSSYMTMVARRFLKNRSASQTRLHISPDQDLSSYIEERFHTFRDKTAGDINDALHTDITSNAKQYNADTALAILGAGKDPKTGKRRKLDDIEQFQAANVTQVKSVTIYPGGEPRENMSFPAMTQQQWDEWADPEATWEDSFIYHFFEKNRFLIVAFKSPVPHVSGHDKSQDILLGGFLWNMPEKDLDRYVRPVWEQVHSLLANKRWVHYNDGNNLLPGQDFNKVFHLRPHSNKGWRKGGPSDRIVLPTGEIITKQGFWLDRRYVAQLITSHGLWTPNHSLSQPSL